MFAQVFMQKMAHFATHVFQVFVQGGGMFVHVTHMQTTLQGKAKQVWCLIQGVTHRCITHTTIVDPVCVRKRYDRVTQIAAYATTLVPKGQWFAINEAECAISCKPQVQPPVIYHR